MGIKERIEIMTNETTRNVSGFNIVDRFTCEKCGVSLEDYVRV